MEVQGKLRFGDWRPLLMMGISVSASAFVAALGIAHGRRRSKTNEEFIALSGAVCCCGDTQETVAGPR
jgi:hypothetical protein